MSTEQENKEAELASGLMDIVKKNTKKFSAESAEAAIAKLNELFQSFGLELAKITPQTEVKSYTLEDFSRVLEMGRIVFDLHFFLEENTIYYKLYIQYNPEMK